MYSEKNNSKRKKKRPTVSKYVQQVVHRDNILAREQELNGEPESPIFREKVKRKGNKNG